MIADTELFVKTLSDVVSDVLSQPSLTSPTKRAPSSTRENSTESKSGQVRDNVNYEMHIWFDAAKALKMSITFIKINCNITHHPSSILIWSWFRSISFMPVSIFMKSNSANLTHISQAPKFKVIGTRLRNRAERTVTDRSYITTPPRAKVTSLLTSLWTSLSRHVETCGAL